MTKKIICMVSLFGLLAISTVSVFAGGKKEAAASGAGGKIVVAATFDAIQELVKVVGQEKIIVYGIIPSGMDAHHFEPKAADLKILSKAQLAVYNGFGMEPWFDHAVAGVNNKDLVVVCAGSGIEPIKLVHGHHHHECSGENHNHEDHDHEDYDCEEHEHHHGQQAEKHEHHHHHGGQDPHTWLSLNSAKVMVSNICDALIKADAVHASFYKKNADDFISEADKVLAKYQQAFSAVPHKHFVTGHAAFGYLCRDFGLVQKSVKGVFSGKEPNAKELVKLTKYCKEHGVKTIFTEESVSPEISATLAKEVGAKVDTIYTLEMAADGLSYMERMKLNLEKIYESVK